MNGLSGAEERVGVTDSVQEDMLQAVQMLLNASKDPDKVKRHILRYIRMNDYVGFNNLFRGEWNGKEYYDRAVSACCLKVDFIAIGRILQEAI